MLKFTVQNKRQQQQLLTKGVENESKEISGEHEGQNRAKKEERNNNDSMSKKGSSSQVMMPGKSFVFSIMFISSERTSYSFPQPQKVPVCL